MRVPLVLSVKHSGTRTVLNSVMTGLERRHAHICESTPNELQELVNLYGPVIVPLRAPLQIALSWKSRGRPLTWLWPALEFLATVVDEWDPAYIPVDSPRRDEHLAAAVEKTGLPLVARGWPMIGRSGYAFVPLLQFEEDQLHAHLDRRLEFWSRFYA